MAIELDIQKNFKGFSLDVRLKGQDGPIGILGASGSGLPELKLRIPEESLLTGRLFLILRKKLI